MTLKKCSKNHRWKVQKYHQLYKIPKIITNSLLKYSKTMNQWILIKNLAISKTRLAFMIKMMAHYLKRRKDTAIWAAQMTMMTKKRVNEIGKEKEYFKKNSNFTERNTVQVYKNPKGQQDKIRMTANRQVIKVNLKKRHQINKLCREYKIN